MLKWYKEIGSDKMEILTTIYYLFLVIWYVFAIFAIIYIYQKNYAPYPLKYQERYYKKLPSDLEPGELSMLMYHKIEPQVFTTTILNLINKGVIELHLENFTYYFKILHAPGRIKLTRSENVVKEFLESISTKQELTLQDFEYYCGTKKGDSEFLFQYDLWKAMIRRESSRKHFFEEKKGYSMVKGIRNIGILLFITNIAGGYHIITGYGTILPILFLPFFFYVAYRRTETYSEEYEKWLSFKEYLSHLSDFSEVQEIHTFTKSAIVLGKMEALLNYCPQNKNFVFAHKLNQIVLKCYRHAYFNGNRSITNLWSFK